MELSELIYRLVNEESLRSLMKVDVETAVVSVGASLSRDEVEALAAVAWDVLPTDPTPQGPNQWWASQLSHCPIPVRLSTPV